MSKTEAGIAGASRNDAGISPITIIIIISRSSYGVAVRISSVAASAPELTANNYILLRSFNLRFNLHASARTHHNLGRRLAVPLVEGCHHCYCSLTGWKEAGGLQLCCRLVRAWDLGQAAGLVHACMGE